jgi:hypothetical protein
LQVTSQGNNCLSEPSLLTKELILGRSMILHHFASFQKSQHKICDIICHEYEAPLRNRGDTRWQLPQEERVHTGGSCVQFFPTLFIDPLACFLLLCGVKPDFPRGDEGWVCSSIKAYLLYCLCQEINCHLHWAFPKCDPMHSQMLGSEKTAHK